MTRTEIPYRMTRTHPMLLHTLLLSADPQPAGWAVILFLSRDMALAPPWVLAAWSARTPGARYLQRKLILLATAWTQTPGCNTTVL